MAITNTWSVTDMQHTVADGGVFLVYWSMVSVNVPDQVPGLEEGQYVDGPAVTAFTATEGGKLRCAPDATSPTYTPYADLTENVVLGWVYDSLISGDETAAEAKARIEEDRTSKVQKQIDAATATSSGTPWSSSEEHLVAP